jgi:hypothetical protein
MSTYNAISRGARFNPGVLIDGARALAVPAILAAVISAGMAFGSLTGPEPDAALIVIL